VLSRFRATVLVVSLAATSVVAVSCINGRERSAFTELLTMETTAGDSVTSHLRDAAVSIVLFQTPTECATCAVDLSGWLELARETSGTLLIVLVEPPTVEQAAALQRMRLNAVTLRDPANTPREVGFPALAVLRDGVLQIAESRLTLARRLALLDSSRALLGSRASRLTRTD
jgi:hypothetical protein